MVTITLVLAAVLGTFSFSLAYGTVSTPQASFGTELDVSSDRIDIIHTAGETLRPERTRVLVVNESDGRHIELVPTSEVDTFETGERVVISTTTGTVSGWSLASVKHTFELKTGITYTIQIIDDKSQSIIYRVSISAS